MIELLRTQEQILRRRLDRQPKIRDDTRNVLRKTLNHAFDINHCHAAAAERPAVDISRRGFDLVSITVEAAREIQFDAIGAERLDFLVVGDSIKGSARLGVSDIGHSVDQLMRFLFNIYSLILPIKP